MKSAYLYYILTVYEFLGNNKNICIYVCVHIVERWIVVVKENYDTLNCTKNPDKTTDARQDDETSQLGTIPESVLWLWKILI